MAWSFDSSKIRFDRTCATFDGYNNCSRGTVPAGPPLTPPVPTKKEPFELPFIVEVRERNELKDILIPLGLEDKKEEDVIDLLRERIVLAQEEVKVIRGVKEQILHKVSRSLEAQRITDLAIERAKILQEERLELLKLDEEEVLIVLFCLI
jgi:hypothetical protein